MVGRSVRGWVITAWVVFGAGTLLSVVAADAGTPAWSPQASSGVHAVPGDDTLVDPRSGLTISVGGGERGRVNVKAVGHGLDVRKAVAADGTFTFTITGGGDIVSLAGVAGAVVIARGGESVRIDTARPDAAGLARAAGLVAGSPALRLFRGAVARLSPEVRESVGGSALEIGDVLFRVLQDDPGAVERLRGSRTVPDGSVIRVGMMRRPCYAEWESEVIAAWGAYESCYNDFSWWSGGREVCALVFVLRAEVAWFQLLSCAGFGFTVP
jgi:hypothetical protein